jgi:hypothetical protein
VERSLHRVRFDIVNNTDRELNLTVQYGDYFKDVFVTANETRSREMISGEEKHEEIFIELNGRRKGYRIRW